MEEFNDDSLKLNNKRKSVSDETNNKKARSEEGGVIRSGVIRATYDVPHVQVPLVCYSNGKLLSASNILEMSASLAQISEVTPCVSQESSEIAAGNIVYSHVKVEEFDSDNDNCMSEIKIPDIKSESNEDETELKSEQIAEHTVVLCTSEIVNKNNESVVTNSVIKNTTNKNKQFNYCYLCSLCDVHFEDKEIFVQHFTNIHKNIPLEMILKLIMQCTKCKLKFQDPHLFHQHMCLESYRVRPVVVISDIPCEIKYKESVESDASKSEDTKDNVAEFVDMKNVWEYEVATPSIVQDKTGSYVTTLDMFCCPKCEYRSYVFSDTEAHMKASHEVVENIESSSVKIGSCLSCPELHFTCELSLQSHLITHHNYQYCVFCKMEFSDHSVFTLHMSHYHADSGMSVARDKDNDPAREKCYIAMKCESRLQCPQCPSHFSEQDDAVRHVNECHPGVADNVVRQTKVTTYHCEKCACVFESMLSVESHVKSKHKGDCMCIF